MAENGTEKETFEAFRKSFFYGDRSDMNFKFLDHLTDETAGTLLQKLFNDVISAIDTGKGNTQQLKNTVLQGQTAAHAHQSGFEYDRGPFTPFTISASETKLTLLTSSGHYPCDKDPKPLGVNNMSQLEAEQNIMSFLKEKPELTEIPFSISADNLCVRHGGYDISATVKDPNITFPWQRVSELHEDGTIGSLTQYAYSFIGACSQKRLLKESIPAWVKLMLKQKVQGALLIPV